MEGDENMRTLIIILSFIIPLLGAGNQQGSQFGWPVHFILYKNGNPVTIEPGFSLLKWEYLSQCSFRFDLYLVSVLLMYFMLIGIQHTYQEWKSRKQRDTKLLKEREHQINRV